MTAHALHQILPLAAWTNFYVIVGTSAGALTGLTFVVITMTGDPGLRADSAAMRLTGLRAFITPTAVHFGSALWLAALLCVPGHTALSGALCIGATSIAGVIYSARVLYLITLIRADYRPFIADWVWNVGLPGCAYLSLFVAALVMPPFPTQSLYVIAGATFLLLAIGIHNAWDVVVWFTTERHAQAGRARHGGRASHAPSERARADETTARARRPD
ncbi:MAG TPA: hypothetical protein VN730_11830 [Steroidobacteraceae bacterium]|nr:hypothetical protein [Steroidobacteraceae bacterium]